MFIAIRLNAMASSVGATCLKRGLSPREIYSAPTELREYLVRRGYKHFRPYGTELRKNLTQKQKVGPLLHRERRDRAEKAEIKTPHAGRSGSFSMQMSDKLQFVVQVRQAKARRTSELTHCPPVKMGVAPVQV